MLKRKREAKSHNSETGETRVNVEFEDALDKIKSMDDSIVPEVKRDARTVEYSKYCKSTVAAKIAQRTANNAQRTVVNATSGIHEVSHSLFTFLNSYSCFIIISR